MPEPGPRIVITRPLPGDPVTMLEQAGFARETVWINPEDRTLTRAALLDAVPGAAALIVTPADLDVDAEVYDAAGTSLVIVSAYAVGVDNIDVVEANRRGILVGHTPHAVTEPTADMAWLLALAAARRAREGLDICRGGRWSGVKPLDPPGRRLVGGTLLIVGAGRIGLATARRAAGFDMSVAYHARSAHPEFEAPPVSARRVPTLEAGLAEADVVSVHTPLTEETRHLIGERELRAMKPTAVLVNTARGPVVDEAALVRALREGWIFGAGLDVYENEPTLHPGLAELPNAFLMPHWGTATTEDRIWMAQLAVDNAAAALRGERLPHEYGGDSESRKSKAESRKPKAEKGTAAAG